MVAKTSSGISGKSSRRGEKGVSASFGGVGVSNVVLNIVLSSLGGGYVEVVEVELCDNQRVIVHGAPLPAVVRRVGQSELQQVLPSKSLRSLIAGSFAAPPVFFDCACGCPALSCLSL
ncbi:hypothetical protein MRX96_047040 [Rhipicephalus microplus]